MEISGKSTKRVEQQVLRCESMLSVAEEQQEDKVAREVNNEKNSKK